MGSIFWLGSTTKRLHEQVQKFLGKADLSLCPELDTPQAHAPLQGSQHAGVPLAGVATLKLFEQGDGVEVNVRLKQSHDLAVPDRIERVFLGTSVALGPLGGQAWGRWEGRLGACSMRLALRSLIPVFAAEAT
jgi:hypothetical protein